MYLYYYYTYDDTMLYVNHHKDQPPNSKITQFSAGPCEPPECKRE